MSFWYYLVFGDDWGHQEQSWKSQHCIMWFKIIAKIPQTDDLSIIGLTHTLSGWPDLHVFVLWGKPEETHSNREPTCQRHTKRLFREKTRLFHVSCEEEKLQIVKCIYRSNTSETKNIFKYVQMENLCLLVCKLKKWAVKNNYSICISKKLHL